MGSFLASLFGGQNKTLNSGINNMGSLAGYSTGVGEKGTTSALNYDLGLLSGDPSKVAQTLSPEIKASQDQAQQNKNTVAQFGNRGGGMNAVMASLDDATRAKLLAYMGQARSGAAADAGRLGTTNLGLASSDTMDESKLAQQRFENWKNSILGQGISTGVGYLEGGGLPADGGA